MFKAAHLDHETMNGPKDTQMAATQKLKYIQALRKEGETLKRFRDKCIGSPPCFWCAKDGFSAQQCCSSSLSEAPTFLTHETTQVSGYLKRQAALDAMSEWERNAVEGMRANQERHRKAVENDLRGQPSNQMPLEVFESLEPPRKKFRTSSVGDASPDEDSKSGEQSDSSEDTNYGAGSSSDADSSSTEFSSSGEDSDCSENLGYSGGSSFGGDCDCSEDSGHAEGSSFSGDSNIR
jgi:hypothetical protein